MSGHQILITEGRTDGRTDAQTGVTPNAPLPFFKWRGIKTLSNSHEYQVQIPRKYYGSNYFVIKKTLL